MSKPGDEGAIDDMERERKRKWESEHIRTEFAKRRKAKGPPTLYSESLKTVHWNAESFSVEGECYAHSQTTCSQALP